MSDGMEFYCAYLAAHSAAEALLVAHTLKGSPASVAIYGKTARDHLDSAARLLDEARYAAALAKAAP